ncbi:LysE family transporter [Azohydromonas caseinilytica]|uniref:LysE family transporter n=1 Tax=Azohydromonas caseinilytica TaxID=2728836 RepID=A0A848F747_9BURK|nr:LysE family transporter [Azohydromonas caseinilytica]NML15937.1 LysE family transporter [Azohydromonas caseinilytica]
MTWLFVSAFGLGLIFNASPGAVFAESFRRGISGGYHQALYVQFGSLVGDATWAVLGLAGAGVIFALPAVRAPVAIVGALYLAYLGVQCFRDMNAAPAAAAAPVDGRARQGALASGASLSLTNPANVFYWAALGSVLGGLGVENPALEHYTVFFLGFMASSLIWCFVCAGLIHVLHRALPPLFTRLINALCGIALIGLAAATVRDVLLLG